MASDFAPFTEVVESHEKLRSYPGQLIVDRTYPHCPEACHYEHYPTIRYRKLLWGLNKAYRLK